MVVRLSLTEEEKVLKGLLAGGITMGVAAVFPQHLVLPFFAGVLGLTSGVYPGMAMADPMNRHPALEWMAAVTFLGLGLVGLWVSPLLLAGAWLLHGIWSFFHHFTALGDGVPGGFSKFCLAYDLVIAGFAAYMGAVGV